MGAIYNIQFPILHVKLMVICFWVTLYTISIWGLGVITLRPGEKLVSENYRSYLVPLNYLILPYTVFMLKGVSIKNIYSLNNGDNLYSLTIHLFLGQR
jgi:hypothetical protein